MPLAATILAIFGPRMTQEAKRFVQETHSASLPSILKFGFLPCSAEEECCLYCLAFSLKHIQGLPLGRASSLSSKFWSLFPASSRLSLLQRRLIQPGYFSNEHCAT